MLVTHIERGYRVSIPEPFRQSLQVGDELAIEMDENGRMVLIPTRRILDILDRTAGLWQSHSDSPVDGVVYVDNLRQGRRLAEQREDSYEGD